ncbi:MAG: gamma-glutamyl-gamma-aminobutyrate hydrolase family protein [Bacteroidota bacterium]
MKLKVVTLFSLLLLCSIQSVDGQDTLLLFHPTAYNLEEVQHLIDEGIFNMDGYHLLGVYHEQETYDYEKARAYIELHQDQHVSIRGIKGSLNPGNLFGENTCSSQFKHLFSISKGALFMGGPDIPPAVYNEPVHLLTSVTDPFRHYCEASYLFHLLGGSQNLTWEPFMEQEKRYLISGICLGMQTLNVATGGTMVQDIPTEMFGIWIAEDILLLPPDQMHRNYADKVNSGCEAPTSYHFHHVKLEKRALLTRGIGFKSKSEPLVLSSHHQALEKLGKGWVIAATSMDGKIIEAIEHDRYPHVFGVQFHPEKPGLFDPSIEHPSTCNSTINFQEAIKNTDSYTFHKAYWKHLGDVLQKSRNIMKIKTTRSQ